MSHGDGGAGAPASLSFGALAPLHEAWVSRNFPGGEASDCLLGIGEELGELGDARDAAEQIDAIGDIAIYLVDFVRRARPLMDADYDAHEIEERARGLDDETLSGMPEAFARLVSRVGRLDHAFLKWKQGIRGTKAEREAKVKHATIDVLVSLNECALCVGVGLDVVIARTWAIVGARDWVTYPKTGRPT